MSTIPTWIPEPLEPPFTLQPMSSGLLANSGLLPARAAPGTANSSHRQAPGRGMHEPPKVSVPEGFRQEQGCPCVCERSHIKSPAGFAEGYLGRVFSSRRTAGGADPRYGGAITSLAVAVKLRGEHRLGRGLPWLHAEPPAQHLDQAAASNPWGALAKAETPPGFISLTLRLYQPEHFPALPRYTKDIIKAFALLTVKALANFPG